MHIRSTDPLVRQCLDDIADAVRGHGGEIHPELAVNHQGERLWLSCPAACRDDTLLRIPEALFVPVTGLRWCGDGGMLSYSGDTTALSAVQRQLLDAMVRLYNATGKIEQVAARFPCNRLEHDPELLALLRKARPGIGPSAKNLAEQFISTRLSSQNIDDSEVTVDSLMPMIDMLNHHPYGPKYGRNEAGDWVIPVQHPVAGSDECFVRYQKGDSLANAMWHGYFERAPRYVASAQCQVQLAGIGQVTVIGHHYERGKHNAPLAKRLEHGLELKGIVLEAETRPALRTFLGLALRSCRREWTQPEAERHADDLIALLVQANIAYFTELLALCGTGTAHFPLRALLADVARHQLGILEAL